MKGYNKNDPKTIQSMFDSIANSYDLTNGILSFQMHRLWNRQLIHALLKEPHSKTILDLCSGTGEIALGYLERCPIPQQAILVDFCAGMLRCAQQKAKKKKLQSHTIEYVQADVQVLPLSDHIFDKAMIAYGIRNVKDPQRCFQEVFRVLKPEGHFGILELTNPKSALLRFGHHIYLKTILPLIGKMVTSNKDAYQYLCNSIHTFVEPTHLRELLEKEGFVQTRIIPLTGGIATMILTQKP
jgi:demethylmenaquinone methyltransferase / 2-methoxy-6-polyprenyl-1,4-benzoquinol methylase